jgi:hypothetical protein
MSIRAAKHTLALLLLLSLGGASPAPPPPAISQAVRTDVVRLTATASIWLADTTPHERNSSAGQSPIFKLKSIQEMAAIRFDARSVKGREVLSARLFLHKAGGNMLRYLRVSTVNQDWVAGASRRPYGPADGATYLWADVNDTRAWSYPGSEFADVVMGMGHSITTYAECKQEPGDWISVELTPELVYALVADHTDGLAVMDGGNPAYFNNFMHGAQAGSNAPYIEVEVGKPLIENPAAPQVGAEPAPAHAHIASGAIKVSIQPNPNVFCWKLELDGKPVPRWQVPYPPAVSQTGREQDHIRSGRTTRSGPVVFYLDNLEPHRSHTLAVAAIARGGSISPIVHLTVSSSSPLGESIQLVALARPLGAATPVKGGERFEVWPAPGLIKISPERGAAMFQDMAGDGGGTAPNAVWDGQTIQLFGGRGEYVSYQLVINRVDLTRPLTNVKVALGDLTGSAGAIGAGDIELFKNWYARNNKGQWQPAYFLPWERERSLEIPDRQRGIGDQHNQSMYVDVYIPKRAGAGTYRGTVTVEAGSDKAVLPIQLHVYDFALPDTLSFWPELNSYSVPANHLDYHRLAHQHRLVFNPWGVQPPLQGAGKDVHVQWNRYDASVGPLLSGEAFNGNRRAGVPTPVLYLPFEDSWPTPLSRQTYNYAGHWPGKGEATQYLVDHYMTASYIGDGLSQSYKDAFLAVQRQFVEHFTQQGWNRTEMQLFYGGKNTHRLDYGSNMWWTTDEPYHWDDWLALQFFSNFWAQGRRALGADPAIWSVRADLSRPMWTGRVLDTIVDSVYWGGFTNAKWYQRAAWLSENTGLRIRAYGAVNPASESNTQTVSTLLQVWLHGGNGFLPWQTLGNDASLDTNDNVAGNTLMVPGARFGIPVVGDMRLKALRDGEQIIEYLVILMERYQLEREQVEALLVKALPLSADSATGAAQDDAEAGRFSTLQDWHIAALRRTLAELIVSSRR